MKLITSFFFLAACLFNLQLHSQTIPCFNTTDGFSYAVQSPGDVTSGDFNGDGIKDVLVLGTSGVATNMSCFLGNGTALSQAPVVTTYTYYPGPYWKGLKAADLNHDNADDIIFTYSSSDQMAVCFSSGNGSFQPPVNYSVLSSPTMLELSDLNNDNNLDAVVSSTSSTQVYLGSSSGAFSLTGSMPAAASITSQALADFNNDGKQDILFSESYQAVLALGNGSGGFVPAATYTTSAGFGTTVIGDYNNDGKKDFAFIKAGNLNVYSGNGLGSFTVSAIALSSSNCSNLVSEDFDNDGDVDLGFFDGASGQFAVCYGNGQAAFPVLKYYFCPESLNYLRTGDVNNDGKKDVLVSINQVNKLTLLVNEGSRNFHSFGISPSALYPSAIAAGNLDADAADEIVMAESNLGMSVNAINIYKFQNNSLNQVSTYTTNTNPVNIALVDLNNDNQKDIVVASEPISRFLNNGNGSFTALPSYSVGTGPYSIGYGDFNSDNKMDLVIGKNLSNPMAVLLGDGAGGVSSYLNLSAGADMSSIVVNDVNNDGFQDILATDRYNGGIYKFLGNGNGTFSPSSIIAGSGSSAPFAMTAADFNNDGVMDLVLSGNSYNSVVRIADGSGGFLPALVNSTPATFQVKAIATGDFNRDGNQDYAETMSNGNGLDEIYVYLGQGNGTFYAPLLYTDTGRNSRIASGDINGDSLPDLTTASNNERKIAVFQNTSAFIKLVAPAGGFCSGTLARLHASKNCYSYAWSPSGPDADSLLTATAGIYSVTTSNFNGSCISTSNSVSVTVNSTCSDVWPGDANSDGTAGNTDILELGLHYAQAGPPRAAVDNSWSAFFANNWTGTVSGGANLSHSDCNGDGTIDLSDTLAVYLNYGLGHVFKPSQISTTPQLSIMPDQPVVQMGSWGSSSVYLGSSGSPVNNIHGIAFDALFDQQQIETDSVYLEYVNSFIESGSQNIHFRKRDFTNGVLHAADSRISLVNAGGNGKVAVLHYKIIQNATAPALSLALSGGHAIDASGTLSGLTTGTAAVSIAGLPTPVEDQAQAQIYLYPNPASGELHIASGSAISSIVITDMVGCIILSQPGHDRKTCDVKVEALGNGVYDVGIYTGAGILKKSKLVICH